MSGHSKWHNIQKTKGAQDAKRAQAFTKIAREMIVAVKEGGSGDPNNNSRLAAVIAKAKAANMPNDNIMRSIKKAAGELSGVNYESLTYEGYGPGGSAIIVTTLTDNKNRTVGDVRHAFDKHGGQMGNTGCVSFTFDNKGVIVVERTVEMTEDKMMELAIEAGADDVVTEEDSFVIYTAPNDFSAVRTYLENAGVTFIEAEVSMIPQNKITLDEANLVKFNKLVDMLEDLDDVQDVYHNVELPEEDEEA